MCTKTINPNNHSAILEPEYLLSMGCGKNRPTIFSFRTGASAIVSVISYLLTAIIKSLNVNNEQLGKMGRPPCRDDDRAQRLEKILIRVPAFAHSWLCDQVRTGWQRVPRDAAFS